MGIGNRALISRSLVRETAHYPSWGSGTSFRSRSPDRIDFSLPLMGIGNYRHPGLRRPAEPSHYPSWGSGTQEVRADGVWTVYTSLPLMGIGNGIHLGIPHEVLVLITPHGDREHPGTRCSSSGSGPSLPLMGIGNWAPSSSSNASFAFSLPLMGIGNVRARQAAYRETQLITPHGDREPPYSASFTPSTPRKRLKIPL